MDGALPDTPWTYLPTLTRLALALAIGLFVGLEREWRGKEAGLRTFGFAGLLGAWAACSATPMPSWCSHSSGS